MQEIKKVLDTKEISSQEIKIVLDTEEISSKVLDQLKILISNAEELKTRQQASEFFQINLSTLWMWTKSGKIPCYSIGNRIYYKRSDLEASLTKIN